MSASVTTTCAAVLAITCAAWPGSCRSGTRATGGDGSSEAVADASALVDGGSASVAPGVDLAADKPRTSRTRLEEIARAEDARRAVWIPDDARFSPDVVVRRRATRALARIADPTADGDLLRALGDEDLEVVGWAAYGLGWSCKGKEDLRVKALAAREATLADEDAAPAKSGRGGIDARQTIARSIGRCGGSLAESVLTGFLRATSDDEDAEEMAYALGAIAGRRALSDETMGVLLDRAGSDPAHDASAAALYAIGRQDHVADPWTARTLTAARAVLAETSPLRGFAVRALEKAGLDGVHDLGRMTTDASLDASVRADAARALGRLGAPGREAAALALARMMKDHAVTLPASLESDAFNVLLAVVDVLGEEPPKSADAALYALTVVPVPGNDPPGLARRAVVLRCAAALGLARAGYDTELLAKCDPDPEGATGERARLTALVKRPLVGERRRAFRLLAASPHVSVREAALEAVVLHPELEEAGRAILVQGLDAKEPGVVATAAQAIVQHPEHVLTLALSEKKAALDPRAPPPTAHPAMDLPPEIALALWHALARPWKEDAVETRTSLLDAAVAVLHKEAKDVATRACTDANITVREHASRALRALGDPEAACPRPPLAANAPAPPTLPPSLAHDTRVTFAVGGKKLVLVFEPALSPVASSRFVALAKAGFYKGIVVHRVVPGYVVQLGDPGADGYGGSGELLRCETSPVPFAALDVGVALAGRDTGSSQVFVTLARTPKLDGDYARVGRAEGDWAAVAEGDVVDSVSVEE